MEDADPDDVDDSLMDASQICARPGGQSVITSVVRLHEAAAASSSSSGSSGSSNRGMTVRPSGGDMSVRKARNEAEKNRRDKLRDYIYQLKECLPMLRNVPNAGSSSSKAAERTDKNKILRVGANYVRMYQMAESLLGAIGCQDVPFHLGDACEDLVMQDLNAGCFVLAAPQGKIVYATKSIENIFGYSQVDLFGEEMKNFVHPDDYQVIEASMTPEGDFYRGFEGMSSSSEDSSSNDTRTTTSLSGQGSPSASTSPPTKHRPPSPDMQRRSFEFRMETKPASNRVAIPQYEAVFAEGFLAVPRKARQHDPMSASTSLALRRRPHDSSDTNNHMCLVFTVKLVADQSQSIIVNSRDLCMDEYVTRHAMDGRFLYTDHRISHVSGYLPDEVSGVNAFNYMLPEDAKWAQVALNQMLSHQDPKGESCYRLRTKSGGFIYLKTDGFLDKDETGKIVGFTCINRLVSNKYAKMIMDKMHKLFAPHIHGRGAKIVEVTDAQSELEVLRADSCSGGVVLQALPPTASDASPLFPASSSDGEHSRESVLKLTGDVRRALGRKRRSESDDTALKRTCSRTASPSRTQGLSETVLYGGREDILAYPAVVDNLSTVPNLPNGALGRSGTTGPDHDCALPTPEIVQPFLVETELDPIQSHLQNTQPPLVNNLLYTQSQLRNNLDVQEVRMRNIEEDLSQVPQSNPGRMRIQQDLSEVQEEHTRHEGMFQELLRETRNLSGAMS